MHGQINFGMVPQISKKTVDQSQVKSFQQRNDKIAMQSRLHVGLCSVEIESRFIPKSMPKISNPGSFAYVGRRNKYSRLVWHRHTSDVFTVCCLVLSRLHQTLLFCCINNPALFNQQRLQKRNLQHTTLGQTQYDLCTFFCFTSQCNDELEAYRRDKHGIR